MNSITYDTLLRKKIIRFQLTMLQKAKTNCTNFFENKFLNFNLTC